MVDLLQKLPQMAADKKLENKRFFKKLNRRPPKDLDYIMQGLHQEEFMQTNCLACANCCKTTGPLFTRKDVERIAKHLKRTGASFQEEFLRSDEEGDMVLQKLPCTFLGVDNQCTIYDVRPKACREFPHTNRKKFQKISNLTLKNVAICPAAFHIVEKMKKIIT